MKKRYFLFIAMAMLATTAMVNAQNVIQGGNMEDAEAWTVNNLNGTQGATVEFNSTATPLDGEGGCLNAKAANNADTMYTQTVVYQQITVTRGVTYKFDAAFRDVTGMAGNWIEVFVSGVEIPEEGTDDYGPGDDLVYVIKPSTDDNGCASENADGMFSTVACSGEGTAMFEGEGDTTVYVALKFGAWGAESAFDLSFDELSLTPMEPSSINNQLEGYNVYPTQMVNELNIELNSRIKSVQIINVLGQSVESRENIGSEKISINVSGIAQGIYYIVITDESNLSTTVKSVKL